MCLCQNNFQDKLQIVGYVYSRFIYFVFKHRLLQYRYHYHCKMYGPNLPTVNSETEPHNYCDDTDWIYDISPDWKGPGWYRMTGAAGTRIPEKSPGVGHCGTHAPGWMSGVHPSTPGDQAVATVCFHWGSKDCGLNVTTTVIHCGDFYLYELPQTPWCVLRYCGS